MRRIRIWVKYGDERLTVRQAAARAGIPVITLRWRLTHGVPKAALFLKSKQLQKREQLNGAPPPPVANTPFCMALQGEITAEEYLKLEDEREPC